MNPGSSTTHWTRRAASLLFRATSGRSRSWWHSHWLALLLLPTAATASAGTTPAASNSPSHPPRDPASHWAFQPLPPPSTTTASPAAGGHELDAFVRRALEDARLPPNAPANRTTLIRRVAFTVTGLPPTPDEIVAFLADRRPDAYARMCERYLNSPRYGECWAQPWLDAAGYADSNGYFSADSDRPLAYRYRDYVIRALNQDLPFDQFVREQLAGDELSGWAPGQPATPAIISQLEATHFLRNGQDGSGESDGNPDEVRTDRYYALESSMQIIGSSLLGLTLQCAKCHDHKFEPLTQNDYYSLQAVLYPAFNVENWVKPNDRVAQANLPGELEAWTAAEKQLDAEVSDAQAAFRTWAAAHRVAGRALFRDSFNDGDSLAARWSHTAPGDDTPAGSPPINLDSDQPPAAQPRDGTLHLIEGGGSGDRWLCTKERFDWKPAGTGQWIQVTFDLVADHLTNTKPAERVGYVLAAHDFNDSSTIDGGNILIDGNPGGATSVHVDYPGADSKSRGAIGATGYQPGHNYGVRVSWTRTNVYTLEHLVDGAVDGNSIELRANDLPPGAFAFEYCCGRSFIVDNVLVEQPNDASPEWRRANEAFQMAQAERKKTLDLAAKKISDRRAPKPGRIAWVTDLSTNPPTVHLLKRGNHKTPGDVVEPAVPVFLAAQRAKDALVPAQSNRGTGRRLAWARWLTQPGSPQSALLARVTVNRIWQQYFGVGLVSTPDNFGLSGAPPTHPQLLDWLATRLIASGWSQKAIHRLILESATFRQSSASRARAVERDPDNHLLWRYPVHRLDANAIRDAMLAASGRLGAKVSGPYVPTPRDGQGEVIVDESKPEAFARTIFLQHRRSQVPTFLGNFDAPSVVFNCPRRAATTMPLQSLSLLNSDFAVKRGADLARRLDSELGHDARPDARIQRAFLLTCGREPDAAERRAARRFVAEQCATYDALSTAGMGDAPTPAAARAWADLGQLLFGLNAFLYLE